MREVGLLAAHQNTQVALARAGAPVDFDPTPATSAAEAVGLLALVAGQDVVPVKRSDGTDGRWQIPHWRIARQVARSG